METKQTDKKAAASNAAATENKLMDKVHIVSIPKYDMVKEDVKKDEPIKVSPLNEIVKRVIEVGNLIRRQRDVQSIVSHYENILAFDDDAEININIGASGVKSQALDSQHIARIALNTIVQAYRIELDTLEVSITLKAEGIK